MEFAQVVRRRRMVRRYRPEPVREDQLARIVDAALRGPTAGFSQGQHLVVVTDPELRSRIADIAGEPAYVARGLDPWISVAPVLVVCCVREGDYRRRYDEPDKRRPGTPAREWPVPYWYVDAGGALLLLLLAAVDEGLAAGFLDLGARGYERLKAMLDIPADVAPIGVVTVGHPADDRRIGSRARGRRPKAEVVHRNRWGGGPGRP